MKKIDEIKVDLVNSKWLTFNKMNLEENPLIEVLSKSLKKDEVVYSIVDGIILLEDKKLAKEADKLAKLQEKQVKSQKPVSEAMQKTMDDVADQLANPKRAGKAIMVMTDRRVITVYEDLNKDYKIKAFKKNVEDIMGIEANKDDSEPNLYNFIVSFGKVVVRMVTNNEQNIKHFEFALDQQIAMAAESQIINQEEKVVKKEAKEIVKEEKVEAKKAPAKKPVTKKSTSKPAAKKTTKNVAKPAAKKVSKPVAKKAPAKKVSKPVAKKTTKKVAAKKAPAKKAAKPVAKKSTSKPATKKVDAVVIGDENKSFKQQEKEISKVEMKQEKETKKDAKKAFKPAKKSAAKKETKKVSKPVAKKTNSVWSKLKIDLNQIMMFVISLLAMGIVAASAVMYATNWQDKYWIPAAACEVAFAAVAMILGVIILIPEVLKKNLSYSKAFGLVLFVFILIIGIVALNKTSYQSVETFEYIITAVSSWLIFDNLYNGFKGLVKSDKKRA